jgi:hypothetical protein
VKVVDCYFFPKVPFLPYSFSDSFLSRSQLYIFSVEDRPLLTNRTSASSQYGQYRDVDSAASSAASGSRKNSFSSSIDDDDRDAEMYARKWKERETQREKEKKEEQVDVNDKNKKKPSKGSDKDKEDADADIEEDYPKSTVKLMSFAGKYSVPCTVQPHLSIALNYFEWLSLIIFIIFSCTPSVSSVLLMSVRLGGCYRLGRGSRGGECDRECCVCVHLRGIQISRLSGRQRG